MDITIEKLTRQLEESGIVAMSEVAATREQAGLTDAHASAKSLARLLVKEGHLTKFQAQLAYGGRAKSLVMGSYVILEKLGEGGMGQVFKARHKRMKREVALKILAPQYVKDRGALQRFHREVEAAARLTHQNIVTAYDADEVRGTHYLVMEYVRGEDLSQIVKRSGPLPVAKAVNCVLQAATGLAYAHSQNVVHRDIKPSNLLLDQSGTVKILDMGLARFDEAAGDANQAAALTGTGMLMGTVDYMSPEQAIDSKTADHRSDIYSLGCTLYLLITGKPMYDGDTVMKRVMAHQTGAIPQLPLDDSQLQRILAQMVAKKSVDRFQSTSEVVTEIDAWLNHHRDQASLQVTAEMPLQPEGSSIRPRAGLLADSVEGVNAQQAVLPQPQAEPTADTSPSSSAYDATVVPGEPAGAGPSETKKAPALRAVSSSPGHSTEAIAIETVDEPLLPRQRRASRRKHKSKAKPDTKISTSADGRGLFGYRKLLLTGGGGLAAVILLSALMFRFTEKDGTVVVTVQGDLDVATVEVDGRPVSFTPDGTDQRLTFQVDPGHHTLTLKTADGLKLITDLGMKPLEIKAGEAIKLRAWGELADVGMPGHVTADEVVSTQPESVPLKPGVPLVSETESNSAEFPSIQYDPSALAKLGTTERVGTADVTKPIPDGRTGSAETLPEPSMTSPPPEHTSAKPTTANASNKAGTLASLELRTLPRAPDLPKYQNTLRSGQPLGEFAAVSHPGTVNDIISWSVEPILHRGGFRSITVRDDGLIATGGNDGAIRLWTSDWQLIKVLPGHANSVVCTRFSLDGALLASVSSAPRDMLAVWDVDTGQLLKFHDVSNWQGHLAWLPDGAKLIHSGRPDLEIIDARTGIRVKSDEKTDSGIVSLSPDGSRFVMNGNGSVGVFETKTLKLLKKIGLTGNVSVDWSGDGKWIAAATSTGVDILDTRSFQKRHTLSASGYAKFSPDSTGIAVTGNSTMTVFNTSDWGQRFGGGSSVGAYEFAWTPDSRSLLTPHAVIDAETGESTFNFDHREIAAVTTAVSSDGSRVATATEQRLRIWNGDNGQLINEYSIARLVNDQLLWQPNGRHLLRVNSVAAESAGCLSLIDADSGKVAHELVGHQGNIWRACWSPDGKQIASVGEDGVCRIWDAATGKEVRSLLHDDPLWWVVWDPSGAKIATGSAFSQITLWNSADGTLLREFKTLSQPLPKPTLQKATDAPFAFLRNSNQIFYMAGASFEMLHVSTGQVTALGKARIPGGDRLSIGWSPDFSVMGLYCGYGEFHLIRQGEDKSVDVRYFQSPHWLSDGRRLFGGDNFRAWVGGYDYRKHRRLGVLMPELPDDAWATLSSDGHFVGSENIDEHVVVVVALHIDGRLLTLSPAEFQERYRWTNDPEKVKFLR